ncbi:MULTISPECIES: glycosyltransferase family 2 protein [unclassified Acidovorax]|uniref:glycosyltransferase n=1 Tax=unclassified Acidovorax TaxID=2684926 RepID=UPI0028834F89|nr:MULTISPECIES: glycosyltransferase family 2 protein [unclassified Acidovorax]
MLEGIYHFWFYFPVVMVVAQFGGGLLARLTTRAANPLRDYTYQPTVSVLLPVYNEGEHVLATIESILACDWPAERLEIVAFDDCSADDSWHWLQVAAIRWPAQLRIHRNPINSGKHVSLSNALARSTGDVLICIDSDCIFDRQVIRELVACFADPQVGAVGGNIGVTNVNDNVLTIGQTMVYYMSFQFGKMLQNLSGHVFCISGCLFAVRRPLFEAVEGEVKGRNWFGLSVRDGEDRYMTHAIMMRGWKTIVNPHATCWTAVPHRLSQFFSQQVRWRRSGLRDLFWTWRRMPEHLRLIGLLPLMAALVPETFTVLWTFLVIATVLSNGLVQAASTLIVAVLSFSSLFVAAAVLYNATCHSLAPGSTRIRLPVLAAVSGIWFFVDAMVITLVALFTFDVGAWGTREKAAVSTDPALPVTSDQQT